MPRGSRGRWKRSARSKRRSSFSYFFRCALRRVDPAVWVSGKKNAWQVAETLDELRHFPLVGRRHLKTVTRRDPFERSAGEAIQYRRPRALLEKLARRKAQRKK